jgi:hypothetical protein
MCSMEQSAHPILAVPRRPKGEISFLQFARAMRDNWIDTYSEEAFEHDIVEAVALATQSL